MANMGARGAKVFLENDFATMENNKTIGIGLRQGFIPS